MSETRVIETIKNLKGLSDILRRSFEVENSRKSIVWIETDGTWHRTKIEEFPDIKNPAFPFDIDELAGIPHGGYRMRGMLIWVNILAYGDKWVEPKNGINEIKNLKGLRVLLQKYLETYDPAEIRVHVGDNGEWCAIKVGEARMFAIGDLAEVMDRGKSILEYVNNPDYGLLETVEIEHFK